MHLNPTIGQNFQIIKIGNATLILGDCYQIVPLIGPVDALVTDPPYEFSTQGGGAFGTKNRPYRKEIEKLNINKGFDLSIFNPELYGSIITFCHNDQLHKILPHLANGWGRYVVLNWRKSNPMPVANKHYQPETEPFVYAWKENEEPETEPYIHAWNKGCHPLGELKDKKRIIDTPVGKSKWNHPTVKPIEVMRKIMINVNGQTILDPFAGTGTTGIAALERGKTFIGIENNPEIFNTMCSRFFEFYAERKLCNDVNGP